MSTDEDAPAPTDTRTTHADTVRFAALWDRYAARVQAYALRHVDPDTAQEVVSETFLVAWRRLVDVPGEPLPWLLVVARNTVANHRRSHHRARLLTDEVARLELVMPRAPDAPDWLVTERDALLRALARLTAREREALLLVAWDGLGPHRAAQVAGCSPTAFKVRLHRARLRLDAALVADDGPPVTARANPAPRTAEPPASAPRTAAPPASAPRTAEPPASAPPASAPAPRPARTGTSGAGRPTGQSTPSNPTATPVAPTRG